MKVRKIAALAGLLALTSTASAKAMMILPPPGAQRVATAECVVLGTVTSIENKPVTATRFPGNTEKVEYLIAVVKVDEALVGAKGMTHVRVGFIPPKDAPNPLQPNPGPVVRPPIRRLPPVVLTEGQEACLFLTKHPQEPFYVIPAYYDLISKKNNPNFAKETENIKKAAKLIADPKAGLESKDAQDRFLTAALLLTRYQTVPPGMVGKAKQEPLSAAESKQILLAIADADWNAAATDPSLRLMSPQAMFNRLTNKTGWTPPKEFPKFPEEAKKWLKANAETYRVQRYVSEK